MLEHVLWLGGPPGAGKTTLATLLARRHGLRLYAADTRTWAHRDRALAAGNAAARRFEDLPLEARWAADDAQLLAMSLHRERGAMVVEDLAALPPSPLIIAEGTVLPAAAVPHRERALWLLPAAAVQDDRLRRRELPAGPRRLATLLAREIAREAREAGLPIHEPPPGATVDATLAVVEAHFATVLAGGPVAVHAAERGALLREANLATAAQVEGYLRRPWASPVVAERARDFLCECGDRRCTASLELTLSGFRRAARHGPLLAPGHRER